MQSEHAADEIEAIGCRTGGTNSALQYTRILRRHGRLTRQESPRRIRLRKGHDRHILTPAELHHLVEQAAIGPVLRRIDGRRLHITAEHEIDIGRHPLAEINAIRHGEVADVRTRRHHRLT